MTVLTPVAGESDELGAPSVTWEEEDVGGVLVAPGAQSEPNAQNRPGGEVIAYTIYFPKSFTGDLSGAEVEVRGERCRVVGHPDRYLVPGFMDYDQKCEVSRAEG